MFFFSPHFLLIFSHRRHSHAQTALERERERAKKLESRLSDAGKQLDLAKVKMKQFQAQAATAAEQSKKESNLNRNLALNVTEMRKNHEAREKLFKQRLQDIQAKLVESEKRATDAARNSAETEQRLLQLKRDFAVDRELLNLAGARGGMLATSELAGSVDLTEEQKERCRQQ